MLGHFKESPNVYFRLDADRAMEGIKLYEWKKMIDVEAHTIQYMRRVKVDEQLASLTRAIMPAYNQAHSSTMHPHRRKINKGKSKAV